MSKTLETKRTIQILTTSKNKDRLKNKDDPKKEDNPQDEDKHTCQTVIFDLLQTQTRPNQAQQTKHIEANLAFQSKPKKYEPQSNLSNLTPQTKVNPPCTYKLYVQIQRISFK